MRHLLILLLFATCLVSTTSGFFFSWWRYSRRCDQRGNVDPDRVPPVQESPVSREQTIVGSCTADVGACPVGRCRYDPDRPESCGRPDGVICPVTENREVDCGDLGTHDVLFVTACQCCKDNGIIIRGQVLDSNDQSPIPFAFLRSRAFAFSRTDGTFSFRVKSGITRLSIRAYKRGYLVALRVIDIPADFGGPIDVQIAMVKIAEPITIDASESNEIPINSDTTGDSRATILIPPGSFRLNGAVYDGNVEISVNFIDPLNSEVDTASPGEFITSTGEPLISGGIFAITYRADTGGRLTLQATVRVPAGMRVWRLSNAGRWVQIETTNRRKRQMALTDDFLVDIQNGSWINIDKIPGAPECFFKARVFDQITNTEIPASTVASFQPSVVTFTQQNDRLRFYPSSTTQPSITCHRVRCPNINTDPDMLLVGLLAMTSYESVSVSGNPIPVVTRLLPRILPAYSAFFPVSVLGAVEYEAIPVRNEAFANFIQNEDGPFYTDLSECQNSGINAPSFHFLKPELPSYLPFPDDTAICTLRISFQFSFSTSILPLAVTAISTWAIDGTNYFHTDTDLMQFDDNNRRFANLCVNYRCSDMEANTTVFIDIDVPNVTVNSNAGQDGSNSTMNDDAGQGGSNSTMNDDAGQDGSNSTVNSTNQDPITRTAFRCTQLCRYNCQKGQNLPTGIDGLLVAPLDIPTDGPDYFQDIPNSCGQQTRNETVAAKFFCHNNIEQPFENQRTSVA